MARSVLVIDGNPAVRTRLAEALRAAGFRPATAATETEAREQLAHTRFDLVVLAAEPGDSTPPAFLQPAAEGGARPPAVLLLPPRETIDAGLATELARRAIEGAQALRAATRGLEPGPETAEGAEEHARQLEEDLQWLGREMDAFCYSISHDLRAPLHTIGGFAQILAEDGTSELSERGRHALARVLAGVQKAGHLLDDLLRLARLARSEIAVEPVDLGRMAGDVVKELRAADAGRKVEVEIAESLAAHGDPKLLRLLVRHLLQNAWKFTRERSEARIEVGAVVAGGEPAFFVRDNGIGFDPARAEKLFAPFQRLHAAGTYEGNGMGLATIALIVRRHRGRTWAESKVEAGATFYFTLGLTAG